MAQASFTRSAPARTHPGVPELLFKADRPRAIDHHIDYFGGVGEPQADGDEDVCGEATLERPA
jgi:hypothetical protein